MARTTPTRRVQALQALIAGSDLAHSPSFPAISAELNAVKNSGTAAGRRRELLGVLHTTRALDTALQQFLVARSISLPNTRALGPYLIRLRDHHSPGTRQLSEQRRRRFQNEIVRKRNMFLHEADRYPQALEFDRVLAEMHVCLIEVLAL